MGVYSSEKLPDCLPLPFVGRQADGDTQPKNGLAHSIGSIAAVCSLQHVTVRLMKNAVNLDFIIIDEAGQVCELHALIPLSRFV
jgi:AAA domain